MLYERHRRETLGIRNRRLLSKTKSSRILEEANTALRDQLQMKQSEIITLRNELEQVRREKHAVEEDRAANAKQRDKEVTNKGLDQGFFHRFSLYTMNCLILPIYYRLKG